VRKLSPLLGELFPEIYSRLAGEPFLE